MLLGATGVKAVRKYVAEIELAVNFTNASRAVFESI